MTAVDIISINFDMFSCFWLPHKWFAGISWSKHPTVELGRNFPKEGPIKLSRSARVPNSSKDRLKLALLNPFGTRLFCQKGSMACQVALSGLKDSHGALVYDWGWQTAIRNQNPLPSCRSSFMMLSAALPNCLSYHMQQKGNLNLPRQVSNVFGGGSKWLDVDKKSRT